MVLRVEFSALTIARYGAPANVAAQGDAVPADVVRGLVAGLLGGGDIVAQGGDTQYAAAAGDNLVVLAGGAGVEYLDVIGLRASRP